MSFTQDVKLELEYIIPSAMHCKCAELAGLMGFLAKVSDDKSTITLPSEDSPQIRKYFTLLDKTYNIITDIFLNELGNTKDGIVLDYSNFPVKGILNEISYENPEKHLKKPCCQRAYLRGVFLAAGFISDPKKGYHCEILADSPKKVEIITSMLSGFGIQAKTSARRGQTIVYTKDAEAVSDMLNLMEAQNSMMGFVEEKIFRDVRNRENRRNNCDTANITKTAVAAEKQIKDIQFIDEQIGLGALPAQLEELARVRLEYPEDPLSNLGNYLDPPVGKSGVNHRLRKLAEIAAELRRKGND